MERAITDFHRDDEGDWVAELDCGHNQHVRHRPPFQVRTWVADAEGRRTRLGTPLNCPLCDRGELPDGLRLVRTSPQWDEHTMPSALRRAHRVAHGTWGRILVHTGRLRFVMASQPAVAVELGPQDTQAIPPDIEHEVHPLESVCFSVDFLAIERAVRRDETGTTEEARRPMADEGGDPACWAGLLCQDCGAVLDGGPHRPGCAEVR